MKLIQAYETSTYISTGGYYGISQPDNLNGQDVLVLLTRDQVEKIVAGMRESLALPVWGDAEEE